MTELGLKRVLKVTLMLLSIIPASLAFSIFVLSVSVGSPTLVELNIDDKFRLTNVWNMPLSKNCDLAKSSYFPGLASSGTLLIDPLEILTRGSKYTVSLVLVGIVIEGLNFNF